MMAAEYVPLLPEEAWHTTVLWQAFGIRSHSADESSDSAARPGLKGLASYRFVLLATQCHFGHTSGDTLQWRAWNSGVVPEESNTDDCGCTWHISVTWEELLWGTAETVCYHSAWWKCHKSLEYNGTTNVGSPSGYHYCASSFGQRFYDVSAIHLLLHEM